MTADQFDEVRQAVTAALEQIRELEDPEAFRAASALNQELLTQITAVSDARAQAAKNIRDASGLSLAQLAGALGVSKARAAQFVRSADAAQS